MVHPSAKGSLDVLLLAAGLSARMGAINKLLVPYAGKPMVAHVAGQLLQADIGPVTVVTGFDSDRVVDALAGLDVRFCFNADYASGQMASVRAGCRARAAGGGAPCPGVMIALADMPLLTAADYRAVASAFVDRQCGKIVVPMVAGARGNPIVVPDRLVAEIADGALNAGCRRLVKSRPDDVETVSFSNPAFATDIDTAADYDRARVPGGG